MLTGIDMKIRLTQDDIRKELLNESHKGLIGTFESSVCKELEAYLKENALEEQKINFSKTYLFFHNPRLVGYVTLLNDNLSFNLNVVPNPSLKLFKNKTGAGYSSVPGLKIGRICIIDEYNSQLSSARYCNLGSIIFASVLAHALEMQHTVGCRVITTDAKKKTGAHEWYKKLGFLYTFDEDKVKDLLAREDKESISMFYDIDRIIK